MQHSSFEKSDFASNIEKFTNLLKIHPKIGAAEFNFGWKTKTKMRCAQRRRPEDPAS